MKPKILLPVLTLIAAAAAFGLWKSRAVVDAPAAAASGPVAGASGAAGARAAAPQSVSVYVVQRRDAPVNVEVAGTVVPLNTVELRPQVSSTVLRVAVKDGQPVRRGDVLFVLDDRNERANLEKARAQLQRDRATLADYERQFKRAQELRAQNFIAQSALDSSQTQFEAQQALLRTDEAAVQAAEVALSYTTLRAPMDGRCGVVNVFPGSLVQPSGAALVTINQIDPIGVSFNVPEAQLPGLLAAAGIARAAAAKPAASAASGGGREAAAAPAPQGRPASGPGQASGGAQPPTLSVLLPTGGERRRGAEPAATLPGRLSFVDNAVDTATGTIRAKGTLPNGQQQLWPGQYVSVRLTLRTLENALVVPQAAIIQRGAERTVYVVGADDTVQARAVQVRQPLGEFVAVDGLSDGERVVVEGKQNLRPGGAVRIAAAPAGKG
ncbi:MAG TPA: efflux RND transporter periplasmic adaptor subunit, partial [Burkholderiaceae bacterium]|nr:efflux RND transporter periplasmic adaptor subunit [Burkholderiaceae bacterium]